MSNYQYIIISATQERAKTTVELLSKVNISNRPIYVLWASLINNSTDFLSDFNEDDYYKRLVCCTRSHLRALQFASLEIAPAYSIILEDDTTFLKNDFERLIIELIEKMDTQYTNVNMANIGWIPCNEYDYYQDNSKTNTIGSLTNYDNSRLMTSFYAVGMQGYIVRKEGLIKDNRFQQIIHSTSFKEYDKKLHTLYPEIVYVQLPQQYAIDHVLCRLLSFMVVYPMMVIERENEPSMLAHHNEDYYWKKYFGTNNKRNNYLR
jgi:GR25 family glycosyltransferase involved in LPS biosynthesis